MQANGIAACCNSLFKMIVQIPDYKFIFLRWLMAMDVYKQDR